MKKTAGNRRNQVTFQLTAEPGSEVFVAGTFNDWNPTQYRMRDNPDNGVFKAKVPVAPGRHEYKFVVNGAWTLDPNGTEWAPNDLGSLNSVISV